MDHTEVEWQFEAGDPGEIEGWLAGRADLRAAGVAEIRDSYRDTGDWRLYRAGYALRVRRSGGKVEATMKSLARAEDGVRRRREISEPLGSGGPKALASARGPVGERLRLLLGARELEELFEIRTRRKTFRILPEGAPGGGDPPKVVVDASGDIRPEAGTPSAEGIVVDAAGEMRRRDPGGAKALGEIALDDAEISAKGVVPARISRVEVEVAPDAPADAAAGIAAEMRDALKLRPAGTSKFEAGLSVAGLTSPGEPDLGPTEVSEDQTATEVAFAVLRRHFAAMLAHEPGVRLGEDPEELHDMRVATRRLRAALKLYAGFLPRRAERFERELKRLAGVLGEVRDLDVHLADLEAMIPASRGEERETLEKVSVLLERRREKARRRMLEALDSGRYERLVGEMSGSLRRGRAPSPAVPILEAAPALVRGRYEKVRKAARRIDVASAPEEFHDLRKKGKRLRYALEPLAGLYGKPADRMVDRLKELQDDLGEHQDLVVFRELLRELATTEDLPPWTVFAMGSLAGGYARRAAEMRERIPGSEVFRSVEKGKGWRKLRKKVEERSGGRTAG